MLRVFQATDKTYSTNGDLIINPTKAEIHKEDNGDFYLDLETIFDEKNVNISAQQGITATSSNGFLAINDNDISKQVELANIEGNTTQEGTPTPSSPVAINVVSGEQDILVCGRNLWNEDYANISSGLKYKPLYVGDGTFTMSSNIPRGASGNSLFLLAGNVSTGANSAVNGVDKTISRTQTSVDGYITIVYRGGGNYLDPREYQTQLEKGNTATEYEEYKGNSYEINLGKNILNVANESGTGSGITYSLTDNVLTYSGTASGSYFNIGSFKTCYLPAGTYTFSIDKATTNNERIVLYTQGTTNQNFVIQGGDKSKTVVLNDIKTNWRIGISNLITNSQYSGTLKLQLEKGSVATTYTPYKTPIELCKIGDYKDRIYKDNGTWYIEKQIGKVVLNGSELGSIRSDIHNENTICYRTDANVSNIKTGTPVFSNYFQCLNNTSDIEHIRYIGAVEYRFQIFLLKTTASTAQQVQTWLSTHNTIVYYILNTPTITEITDTELLSQLNAIQLLSGLNNITISSADLVGQITIRYNYLDAITNSIKYVDYLVPNNIIVANTPQGEQAFRISNVDKTRRKIKLKAYHVFYDSENYLIEDSYVVDKNCNDALDHLNNATSDTSPFTTISNVSTIDSYRCVRKSLFEAIQVVIERWGGHLVRDNWTIGVYNTIGQDNGVTIRYGKNLKDITASYNWDEVVTKLLPVGKDGILLNALDPTTSIYVESTIQYDIPYTKKVSFEQDNISEDDYKDEQGNLNEEEYKQALVNDLSQKAQNYVQNNSVPKVNYTLSANVEKVSDIGDTIEVIDEKLGINIMTNIISYDYNCILDKYTELEFGNFTPELKNLMTTITEETEKIVEEGTNTIKVTLTNELQEATSQIWNALGNSYVIYEGDKILIVDSLPKETATNVIMINNGGIGFSQTGITGTFQSAWTIDNVLNMEQINVINLTADLIKGGTLKLGSNLNQNGQIEVYDESNSLIAELNKNGLKMYGVDGSYVLMNNSVGFAGYDRNDTPIYWVNGDEFHMKKSVVEEEITLCNKMRFIPITITDGNNNIVNDGIGLVSVAGGGN